MLPKKTPPKTPSKTPLSFQWDPLKKSKMIEVWKNGKGFTLSGASMHFNAKSIYSTNLIPNSISSSSGSKVQWELTLRKKGRKLELVMGFIDLNSISKWKNTG